LVDKFTRHETAAVETRSHLLDIDAAAFRDNFSRRPFLIRHRLVGHPLLEVSRLLELAQALPEKFVEYNAGNIPLSIDPDKTPRNGLSVEETIRRIAECKSWMVLKYVEHDPAYRDLLERCLAEVRMHSEAILPGMGGAEAFIFVTSPGSVTPSHLDPEHNFLLQVHGSKRIYMCDPADRTVVSEEALERFYSGGHRNLNVDEASRAKAWTFDLRPGQGLHFPVTAPHWVVNGSEVSVSFSITFRTPDLDRRGMIYQANAALRKRGWKPAPVGQHPWRDRVKCLAYRTWRRARRLLGRPVE
jgi:ribosomal protein L16 Arg81 hydroxylase